MNSKPLQMINRKVGEALRVGYVLYDYPALSQSFVHGEIKWLLGQGVDAKVYYKAAPDRPAALDYSVDSFMFSDKKELLGLVKKHRRQLLHAHFAYPAAALYAWPVAEKAGIPFTVMPHAVDIFAAPNMKRNHLRDMGRSPLCLAIFALGPFHGEFYIKNGVPEDKVVLKPNGVDESFLKDAFEISDRPVKRVVHVGRLVEKKGLTDLIAAAKRVSDLGLVFDIYGYGPEEEKIKKAAEGLPNINVHTGGLPHAGVRKVLREADLLFIPCKRAKNGDMDGLPTVIMEAAALGVPVLTTDISSIPVMMEDGVTGFVCRPGDIDCFEKKLRSLAGKKPSEFGGILTAARQRVLDNCDPDKVNRRLLDTWVSYGIAT